MSPPQRRLTSVYDLVFTRWALCKSLSFRFRVQARYTATRILKFPYQTSIDQKTLLVVTNVAVELFLS
jgi:hypothetical protein